MTKKIYFSYFPVISVIILALALSVISYLQLGRISKETHFSDLSYSFVQGRLDIPEPIKSTSWQDTAKFDGRYYVFFGPIPALLLSPWAIFFSDSLNQQALALFAFIINFFLWFMISKRLGVDTKSSIWAVVGLLFGSVYLFLTLVGISAYLVQIISFTFLSAAIYCLYYQRSWVLIGSFVALAGATRAPLYLSAVFFALQIILHSHIPIKSLVRFLLPILLSLVLLGSYNYLRFGSAFNTGYAHSTTWPKEYKKLIDRHGMFSINHIPTNLYLFLLKGPEAIYSSEGPILKAPFLKADHMGMSIFFTSPFLVFALFAKLPRRQVYIFTSSILIGFLPALMYVGLGSWQYGYRYALDIYPFLFVLFLKYISENSLTYFLKFIIIASILFNWYLMGSIWGLYPIKL